MADLEPITREEMLLDGQDLEPITRKEMFIKRIYDKTQVIPEPITREEMFLKKAGEGGSDVDIEQLNVSSNGTYSEQGKAYSPVIVEVPQPTITKLTATENRTYTAPSGIAYDEVDVNVPLPSNAYLLKDLSGLPADIATFTDGSSLPMPKLEVAIEPIQEGSGDPSPTNIRPISGWSAVDVGVAGKNLLNANTSYNVVVNTTWINTPCDLPKGTYTFSYKPSSEDGQITFNVYNEQNERIYNAPSITNSSHEVTFTIDERASKISSYSNSALTISEIQIEKGSTATTYEPYNPNSETITIQLGDTYYGAKLDVVSGVLTVDRVEVDLGSMYWNYSASDLRFYNTALANAKAVTNVSDVMNGLCDHYKTVAYRYINATSEEDGIIGMFTSGTTNYLAVKDTRYTSSSDFTNAVSGTKLVYELATPIEIQLTPTPVNSLEGVNNIWADCGEIINGQYFSKGE